MKFLKGVKKAPVTAAELFEAIQEVKVRINAARQLLEEQQGERKALLLDGTDIEVREWESRLAETRLEIDRGQATLEELEKRHKEAGANEEEARLDRLEEEAREKAQAYREIALEYEEMASQLVPILERAKAARANHLTINQQLVKAGRQSVPLDISQFQNGMKFFSHFEENVFLPVTNAMARPFWSSGQAGGTGGLPRRIG
jgi:chromosome segregation ATPase